jgi:hypothetical protein
MFVHTCTACAQRQLIFPSQITGLSNTDHGIVMTFTCWCDAEQAVLTGSAVERHDAGSRAA